MKNPQTYWTNIPNKYLIKAYKIQGLKIVDELGREISHFLEGFVNEIPNGVLIFPAASNGDSINPLFEVPYTGNYTIFLSGSDGDREINGAVTISGDDHIVFFEGLEVNENTEDTILISSEEKSYNITSNLGQELDITISTNLDNNIILLKNLDISQNSEVQILELENGNISVYSDGNDGLYDLEVVIRNEEDGKIFSSTDVPLEGETTQILNIQNWIESDENKLAILIDTDQDGAPNEEMLLKNQDNKGSGLLFIGLGILLLVFGGAGFWAFKKNLSNNETL